MRVLDTTFLIDYLDGVEATREFYEARGGESGRWIDPEGPFLDGPDALVAAVGKELDAPVVAADSDLTHEETRKVVDVEEY